MPIFATVKRIDSRVGGVSDSRCLACPMPPSHSFDWPVGGQLTNGTSSAACGQHYIYIYNIYITYIHTDLVPSYSCLNRYDTYVYLIDVE